MESPIFADNQRLPCEKTFYPQYLRRIWEFTPDNPLLIGFLVKMYMELMEKEGLGLKDLDFKLEERGEYNEEGIESLKEFVEEAKNGWVINGERRKKESERDLRSRKERIFY